MIKSIRDRFGKYSLVQLIGYPLIALIVTPIRLVQSLWNSRVLLSSKISDYAHFNIHTGLNSLFYHTRALNLKRFGRSGKSPYLGLGNFNLARCFHYSLFSLYGYWKGGAALVLLCMFGWWGSMFLFVEASLSIIDVVLLLLILISTNFYANTFRYQNYNAVGWLFFPLFIFSLLKGFWLTAGIALLLSTFGSFTVVVLGGMLAFSYGVYSWSFWPIVAALPAAIKLLFHFLPFFSTGDTKKVIVSVLKAIGLSQGNAKYKRKNKGNKFTIFDIYHLLLIIQFILVFYFLNTTIPFLLVVSLGISIINTRFFRFADEQSMHILLFTLSVIYALSNPSWVIAISMWLAISPLPFLTGFDYDTRVLSMVPVMKPFNVKSFVDRMHLFFNPVQKDEQVYMSFKDPDGVYENIYEGYRQLIELPSYVANQKSFLLFPEWWSIFELNYEDAPNIWGRSVSEVKSNMIQWSANYAMVYQDSNTELDPQWMVAGFELLSTFDWNEFEEEFKNHKRFKNISFKWFLLKPKLDS